MRHVSTAVAAIAAVLVASALPGEVTPAHPHVVVFARGAGPVDLDAGALVADLPALGMAVVDATNRQARALHRDPDVAVLAADRTLLPTGLDGDPDGTGLSAGPALAGGLPRDGAGTTIAVIDTGISAHPDLTGRIVGRLDLTGTGHGDGYGHGTAMAGIAAGDGTASGGRYVGVAPAATLVAVKVAGDDGTTTMSTLMAGLQAVIESADHLGTDVALLAYSTPDEGGVADSPFAHALQRLHEVGIVPVVSAGNGGRHALGAAASAPAAITVGAYDASTDAVAEFSSRGPTRDHVAKPDVIAPGTGIVAPIAPGSTLATDNPGALVGDGTYLRGSGTSHAAAATAGAVAVLAGRHPNDSSRQLHTRLLEATVPATGHHAAVGRGRVTLSAAPAGTVAAFDPAIVLDTTRLLPDGEQATLTGAFWASGNPGPGVRRGQGDDAPGKRTGQDPGTGPQGSNWSGSNWSGSNWSGSNWSGSNWSGSNWSGSNWSGSNWSGSNWSGSNWSGSNWSSNSWE